ncbi:FAD-dependent monooxygenase [Actinomadura rudentiformis]|uniref:NAD(P)-binding protein n=1 Tax=Actinomadura rudentiformis TaxID=359158 RepID=A0A6H9YV40_9ACTN|nr:FAD-dependent monooxygenase [Actinomadura rudentiformis]KAB2348455.1 NAD(P)-binding protein [Actinomadura rudentiformis]
MTHRTTRSHHHEVVVIGAGPAGLVAATQLAHHGLDVLVLDKRAEVSALPRAVGVTVRQMEIFRGWGLEEELRAGADEVDLALLQTRTVAEARDGIRVPINVPDLAQSSVVSPTAAARVPQDHLEQVLADHFARLTGRPVRRGAEVVGVSQDEGGVRLSVRGAGGHGSKAVEQISAAYVVAADGAHSPTREHLGIASAGVEGLMRGISVEFRAPLWPVLGPHRYALYSISHPDGAGVLIPSGGGTRWQFGVVLRPDDDVEALAHPEALAERIRLASGVPDLPVHLVRQSAFTADVKLSTAFSSGRVFLAGDAAHRVTPRGGNGLAMAVRGGLAIGWRLAWVLRGWAPAHFLDTYEAEVRPLMADDVARAADPQGHCHAVLTELLRDLGGRLQHAWVGPGAPGLSPVSTLDLVGDGLTLFVGDDDTAWRAAVARVDRGVPVDVVTLPRAPAHALGLHAGGGLLVRPDAVPVARWYRVSDVPGTVAELERAVDEVLDHRVTTMTGAA